MGLTVLLGGARSGKSRLAVRLAAASGRAVTVIATGEPTDEEMAERIRRHRAERPLAWTTIEEPVELESALRDVPEEACALVDCLTLWVANLMQRGEESTGIAERSRAASAVAAGRMGGTVAVSNEVGSGIVPVHPLARAYRDVLGTVNSIWAEAAAAAGLVVAGRVLRLGDLGALEGGSGP